MWRRYGLLAGAVVTALFCLMAACSQPEESNESAGTTGQDGQRERIRDVDPPEWARQARGPDGERLPIAPPVLNGPSVKEGQSPGIEVGDYAPDFQLEPVEVYPQIVELLGDKAPKSFEDKVMFSDLVGEKPVMLVFGSYT